MTGRDFVNMRNWKNENMRVLFSRHVQSICCFVVSPWYCCSSYLTLFLLSFLIHLWKYELLISLFSLYYYWIATWLCSSSYLHTTFIVYTPMSFPQIIDTVSKRNNNLSFLCYCILITSWLLPHYMADFQCKLTLWVRSVIVYSNLHLYWHVHFYLDKKALRLCKAFLTLPHPSKNSADMSTQ